MTHQYDASMKEIIETIAKIGIAVVLLRVVGTILLIALAIWLITLVF